MLYFAADPVMVFTNLYTDVDHVYDEVDLRCNLQRISLVNFCCYMWEFAVRILSF